MNNQLPTNEEIDKESEHGWHIYGDNNCQCGLCRLQKEIAGVIAELRKDQSA